MNQYRCQKCRIDLIELEPNYENMTEGQMVDYDSGFNHIFYCPECKSISILDGEDTYGPDDLVDYKKQGEESYAKMQRSEEAAIKYFRGEKCEVAKIIEFRRNKGNKYTSYVTTAARRIFKKARKNIPKILGYKGLPDYVYLNKKKLSFSEVKNSYDASCKPSSDQIRIFNIIKKMKMPMKIFVYEGKDSHPDILDWNRQTPKLFKGKVKKKEIRKLDDGQTSLSSYQ